MDSITQLDEVDFEISKVSKIIKKGDVMKALEIPVEKKKNILRQMLLIRQFELTVQDLFFQDIAQSNFQFRKSRFFINHQFPDFW